MASKKDALVIEYKKLDELVSWDKNPKSHNVDQLVVSFERYGFKDPLKWEPTLNDGSGGVVEGNGRLEALRRMRESGDHPPRGIVVDSKGEWSVPVLFGVDSKEVAEAEAYGLDHNSMVLSGSGFDESWVTRLYDQTTLQNLFDGFNAPPIVMAGFSGIDGGDVGVDGGGGSPLDDFPSIDDDLPTDYRCPKCHYEWSGKAK
jgi:hypothetical protein